MLLTGRYSTDVDQAASLTDQVLRVLDCYAQRLSVMVAGWLRVGYVQSNFNSDNCLASGRTMDYGPFGFVERFQSDWVMWTGGGEKFGFLNQPGAAFANYLTFASALAPLLEEDAIPRAQEAVDAFRPLVEATVNEMWAAKLGLLPHAEVYPSRSSNGRPSSHMHPANPRILWTRSHTHVSG